MVRVQVYVDEEDDRWLEERARLEGTTKAALVRDGIRILRAQETPVDQEPLLQLIGHIDDAEGGPTDVAEQHDRYLTQWKLDRMRRP